VLDASMQARGKAHIARVVGKPRHSAKYAWGGLAVAVIVAVGTVYLVWQPAPGDDQLARLTVLSACDVRTPGQAWLEARSAAGADGEILTSSQRRAAMDFLLGGNADGGCESLGSEDNEREALAFSEGNDE